MTEPKKLESSKQAETLYVQLCANIFLPLELFAFNWAEWKLQFSSFFRQMMPAQQAQSPSDDTSEDSSSELHCLPCYENRTVKRTIRAILLGQIMSLCLCGTGIGSELLARNKFNAPAGLSQFSLTVNFNFSAQNFLNYFLLFFVYGLMVVCRSGDRNMLNVLRRRGWKYLILAFVDVQANYLIVYAYQFTSSFW